jgi:hypothetical protein
VFGQPVHNPWRHHTTHGGEPEYPNPALAGLTCLERVKHPKKTQDKCQGLG